MSSNALTRVKEFSFMSSNALTRVKELSFICILIIVVYKEFYFTENRRGDKSKSVRSTNGIIKRTSLYK